MNISKKSWVFGIFSIFWPILWVTSGSNKVLFTIWKKRKQFYMKKKITIKRSRKPQRNWAYIMPSIYVPSRLIYDWEEYESIFVNSPKLYTLSIGTVSLEYIPVTQSLTSVWSLLAQLQGGENLAVSSREIFHRPVEIFPSTKREVSNPSRSPRINSTTLIFSALFQ